MLNSNRLFYVLLCLWPLMAGQASPEPTGSNRGRTPGNENLLRDLLKKHNDEALAWISGVKKSLSSGGSDISGRAQFAALDRIRNQMQSYQWSQVPVEEITFHFLEQQDLNNFGELQLPPLTRLAPIDQWLHFVADKLEHEPLRSSKSLAATLELARQLAKPALESPVQRHSPFLMLVQKALYRCYADFSPTHPDPTTASCLDLGARYGDKRAFEKSVSALQNYLTPLPEHAEVRTIVAEPAYVLVAGSALKDFQSRLAPELDEERKVILDQLLGSGKLSPATAAILSDNESLTPGS